MIIDQIGIVIIEQIIPTHSFFQAVYLFPRVRDVIVELDEQFSLKRLGEVIHNNVLIGAVLKF